MNTPHQDGLSELRDVHPKSLRGSVEGSGGTYLTGGGASFTSTALARFFVDVIYTAANQKAQQEVGRTNAGDETGGTVKRFALGFNVNRAEIIPATNGAFVWYDDYLKLYKQLAAGRADAQPTKPAAPRLLGWRTSDYLMETADKAMAENWSGYHQMLPIFEGDPHTKLVATQGAGQQVED